MSRSPIAVFCSATVCSRRWRFTTQRFSISTRILNGSLPVSAFWVLSRRSISPSFAPASRVILPPRKRLAAVLRVTVTRGAGPRGLAPPEAPRPTIFMTLSPMPAARKTPLSLHVATATRRNEHSALSRIKALPYLDNVLALSEARAHGADEALMLNTRGTIACATAANVFVVREGRLETPPVSDGALPGTMRALVLCLAKGAGLAPVENSLHVKDLAEADAVLLTNSISRVMEASSCDGAPLARRAGAAVERLRGLIGSRFDAE